MLIMLRKIISSICIVSILLCITLNVKAFAAESSLQAKIDSISNVQKVIQDDFDGDGTQEAFVFSGTTETGGGCSGKIYFVNSLIQCINDDAWSFADLDSSFKAFRFNSTTAILFEMVAGNGGSWTAVYAYIDGKLQSWNVAGTIFEQGNSQYITINQNGYDAMYDGHSQMFLGRSWNQRTYYFGDHGLHEYGAAKITEAQLCEFQGGKAAIAQIHQAGYEIVEIFYLDNGILQINICTPPDESKSYSRAYVEYLWKDGGITKRDDQVFDEFYTGTGYASPVTEASDDGFVVVPVYQSPQVQTITVKLNGIPIAFDQTPQVENGRVLVPMRAIFEAFGATVSWNNDEQLNVAATLKDGATMKICEGMPIAIVHGRENGIELYITDTPAKAVNGRILVPIRLIAEVLGAYVTWDAANYSVEITSDTDALLAARVLKYTRTPERATPGDFNVAYNNWRENPYDPVLTNNLAEAGKQMGTWEGRQLDTLLNQERYISNQFKNYMEGNPAAQGAVNLSALIFAGELMERVTSQNPEVEKYKTVLLNFINQAREDLEQNAKVEEVKNIVETCQGAVELLDLTANLDIQNTSKKLESLLEQLSSASDDQIDTICDEIFGQLRYIAQTEKDFSITLKGGELSKCLDVLGFTVDSWTIGQTALQDYVTASNNAQVYQEFAQFLRSIQKSGDALPQTMKIAASEVEQLLTKQYDSILEKATKQIVGVLGEKAIVDLADLSVSSVLGQISLGLDIGTLIGNMGLGMSDLTDGVTYTIGYAYLCEFYRQRLIQDQEGYKEQYNQSYQAATNAAQTFQYDYELLRRLRICGEQSYLSMADFDSAALGQALRNWTNYEVRKEYCSSNIDILNGLSF